MPPVVFALVSVPALLYLLTGVLIGTSHPARLISTAVAGEGVMCLGALAAVRLRRRS